MEFKLTWPTAERVEYIVVGGTRYTKFTFFNLCNELEFSKLEMTKNISTLFVTTLKDGRIRHEDIRAMQHMRDLCEKAGLDSTTNCTFIVNKVPGQVSKLLKDRIETFVGSFGFDPKSIDVHVIPRLLKAEDNDDLFLQATVKIRSDKFWNPCQLLGLNKTLFPL